MTNNSDDYGTQAAAAIAARLVDMRAAAAALEAARINGETYADADSVRDAVSRMALGVTLDIIGLSLDTISAGGIASAATEAGANAHALLADGGPSVRISAPAEIIGAAIDIDYAGAILEARNWGTPWQSIPLDDAEAEAVEWAAQIILG